MTKQYADVPTYEAKLDKVMGRLGIQKYNYDWSRFSCWVEFQYKGHLYRFDHSIENAKKHGQEVKYGSDIFAQVVLSLEDIARMTERGIYELQTWIAGMKALPAPSEVPDCLKSLGFSDMPDTIEKVKQRYRYLAKRAHPDTGGSDEWFDEIKKAYDQAVVLFPEAGE